jgi:hypothetical protein
MSHRPTPLSPGEATKLLYEELHKNQDSQSPEAKPRARTYLSREEAAEYLRISPGMLRDHYKHIPSYKFGGKTLYAKKDLDGIVRLSPKSGNVDGETSQPGWKGPRTYLNRNEAAKYLRLSPKSLENLPKHIPYHKLGDRVLYIKEELDEIIRRNMRGGES